MALIRERKTIKTAHAGMRKRRPCAKPTLDSSARLAFTSPCRLRCLRSTLPHARATFNIAACDGLHSTLPHATAYIQLCRTRRPTFNIAACDGLHSTLPHATAYIRHCRMRRPTFDIAARDGLHSTLPHARATFYIAACDGLHSTLQHATAYIQHCCIRGLKAQKYLAQGKRSDALGLFTPA